ncbi:MAG: hypothetical protein MSS47_04840, partial [Bacteroidales bacterium]|nr:hypothetical protein [Bacteroidales bacterium]
VKSIKFSAFGPQKTPSLARQWGRDKAYTVSDTGFSVTLTEIFVADTVWELCGFRPSSHRFSSICRPRTLHVIGREIHVLRTVCKI